jgi:hypothetical protein
VAEAVRPAINGDLNITAFETTMDHTSTDEFQATVGLQLHIRSIPEVLGFEFISLTPELSHSAAVKEIKRLGDLIKNDMELFPKGIQPPALKNPEACFLGIAKDIRDMIYEYTVTNYILGRSESVAQHANYGDSIEYGLSPEILRVCRQMGLQRGDFDYSSMLRYRDYSGAGARNSTKFSSLVPNPFYASEAHPVEYALGEAKQAAATYDVTEFKNQRALVLEYLESQYQALILTDAKLTEYIKEAKRKEGVLDPNPVQRLVPRFIEARDMALATFYVDEHAQAFIRKKPLHTQLHWLIYEKRLELIYSEMPRENAIRKMQPWSSMTGQNSLNNSS